MATITLDNTGMNAGAVTYTTQAAAFTGQTYLLFNDTDAAVDIAFTPDSTVTLTFDGIVTNDVKINSKTCMTFLVTKTGAATGDITVAVGAATTTHRTSAQNGELIYFVRSGLTAG